MQDRLIKALLRQPVDRTPIWLMRQAGRYLPEYRKIRAQAGDFLSLCKNPELACEVTLQPLRRFDLDAAIIFSDILTIPDAMQLGLYFSSGEGPCFKNPAQTRKIIENLPIPDPEDDLGYVMQAIRLSKQALQNKIPLIGFAGSPWTIACYMVEGGPSKTYSIIKKMLYDDQQTMQLLLQKLSDSIILYLNAQIAAGADVIMLFDSWGGILTPDAYENFSLHYMRLILQKLNLRRGNQVIPTILFTKNGGNWLNVIADSGCNAIGLDWTIDIGQARQQVGNKVALQGNLDPAIMTTRPDNIISAAQTILNKYGTHNGHIFNLGHGITPNVPPEHVEILVETVHANSFKNS